MRFHIALALGLAATGCGPRPAPADPGQAPLARLTVFAPASTTDVLREAGRRFEDRERITIAFSFDSSSTLARQVIAGAPADVLISADERWMDAAASAGAIDVDTRHDLLSNTLVMIAPAGRGFTVQPTAEFDIAAALPEGTRIAIGEPSHVPAGRYARQALESLGWWASLEPLLLPAQDVRAALRLVELGEADAGIVYATDAAASDSVVIIAAFLPALHDPIRYPIALCSDSEHAPDFVRFLRTPEMIDVFERAGFGVLPATGDR